MGLNVRSLGVMSVRYGYVARRGGSAVGAFDLDGFLVLITGDLVGEGCRIIIAIPFIILLSPLPPFFIIILLYPGNTVPVDP